MPRNRLSTLLSPLAAFLTIPVVLCAYDYPVSDTAVRAAYFMGQRRDISLVNFLERYARHLPVPASGPYVSLVSFLTPFEQLVEYSRHYQGNFSAQQAEIAHRKSEDKVIVAVEIQLTPTYGPFVSQGGKSLAAGEFGSIYRSSDFWRDFKLAVKDDETTLEPAYVSGSPHYFCDDAGNCILAGATVELIFPADSFHSGTAQVQVTPPEGEPVGVRFDLDSLR